MASNSFHLNVASFVSPFVRFMLLEFGSSIVTAVAGSFTRINVRFTKNLYWIRFNAMPFGNLGSTIL